ncbi:MAG TPA: serine hydrolase domain-containing protein [Polyangiaceae bacterium]|nr:serine hydrolase domain-containing protein [Polyangiaceae bacterium]
MARSRSFAALPLVLALAASACSDDGGNDAEITSPADGPSEPATEGGAAAPALGADEIAELEARAERLVAAGVPGVSIAVLAGGESVFIARGVADRTTGEPMTPEHRFRVASASKSVVASVVLQLVDEGKLALADRIGDWLPGMLTENTDASIEDLLRLESGIFNFEEDERHMAPYRAGDFEYSWSPEGLVGLAAEHPAMFAPGTRFYYSNTNFVLLALVVQKIEGDALANVVQRRIFEPLGMHESSMPVGSELESPFAHGYMLGLAEEPIDVTAISASSVFGNGNLVSTARDIALFYGALARGEVVGPRQLPAMLTPHAGVDTHYGMGVWRWDYDVQPCARIVGHDGAAPGYDITAFSNLEGTRQYAVLNNVLAPGDVVGDAAAQLAYTELVHAAGCN